MKLLFDQNISFRILKKVKDVFPDAKQVRMLGLEDASDPEIWEFAKANNYCIVTFDSDFIDMATLKGYPPKIIWLRTGNLPTDRLAEVLMAKYKAIKDFLENPSYANLGCLEIQS